MDWGRKPRTCVHDEGLQSKTQKSQAQFLGKEEGGKESIFFQPFTVTSQLGLCYGSIIKITQETNKSLIQSFWQFYQLLEIALHIVCFCLVLLNETARQKVPPAKQSKAQIQTVTLEQRNICICIYGHGGVCFLLYQDSQPTTISLYVAYLSLHLHKNDKDSITTVSLSS